jgi:adenylate cyclase
VDKYTGDGAMVLFGVPEIDEDHCYNAVCCALLFRRAVEHRNQQRALTRQEPIRFRFGLNCGEMLAGTMGSEERMQYTVVGDTVNLAARLCGAAELNQIVVSAEFLDQAMLQQRVVSRPHKSIFLRGKAHPVETYIIEDLAAPWRELLEYRIRELLAGPVPT